MNDKLNSHKKEKLNSIGRITLAKLPTPLERLNNLSRRLDPVEIFMKRDDLTGNCFGGNKERKLEFIMADAYKKKATVAVTVGALQSNHCRMTAAIASSLGLKAELILIENEKTNKVPIEGNYFLDKLMGAQIHVVKANEVNDKIDRLMRSLQKSGERPYFIEGGGHNVLGTIGYVLAMEELKKQIDDAGISPNYLILPTGTGTTQAGLILGKKIFNFDIEIIGISVARSKKRCFQEIMTMLRKTEEYLNLDSQPWEKHITVYDNYIGKGYALPTKEGMSAMRLMAQVQGIIIDPVYNAKALAGMLDLISKKKLKGPAIYLNTGGVPALFMRKFVTCAIKIKSQNRGKFKRNG